MKNSVVGAIILMLASAHLRAAVEIPPRPADYLLDEAHVFQPEVAHRLVESLKTAAREHAVHVYVLALPTLKVMPSHIREKLEEFRAAAEQTWLEGQVGAVVVFDDESGWATMGVSAEAQRVFSTVAIHLIFEDPQLEPTGKRLTPAKLEASALTLANHFNDLKIKLDDEARRQRTRHIVIGVIAFWGLLGGAGLVFKKRPAPAAPEREETAILS